MRWRVLVKLKDKTDAGIYGVEWATWQTAVLNCAKVGRVGMWCGRTFQCIIVRGKKVYL